MARLRTIPSVLKWLQTQDPDTAISENWLRRQINKELIPCHRAGKRYLIDLDCLEQYLSNPPTNHLDNVDSSKIRRISDR